MDQRDRNATYQEQVEHYRNMVDSTKSFVTPAIFTLILYFFLWIPGLIANIMYLREAMGIQRRTGKAPEGKGCLTALIIVVGGSFGAIAVYFFLVFMAVLGSS